MRKNLTLDERELKEIQHCLYYRQNLAHGTVGHNLLMLVGKIADAIGFEIGSDSEGKDALVLFVDSEPKDIFAPEGLVTTYESS